MVNKTKHNEPVGGHMIDLLLTCGHINAEPIEAAIYEPKEGEWRYCSRCKDQRKIMKVGGMYWVEKTN